MKKINLLWILMLGSSILLYGQADGYQASVNTGLGFRFGYAGNIWKAKGISENNTFISGIDATLTYGISELISIYGSYQRSFGGKLDGREINFLVYTEEVRLQNFLAGLKLNLGSPSSSFRYTANAGFVLSESNVSVFLDNSDLTTSIYLRGPGFHGGLGVAYFTSPFLSIDLGAQFVSGKFNYSEYLGISYTESNKYSNIQVLLGLNYHFAGR